MCSTAEILRYILSSLLTKLTFSLLCFLIANYIIVLNIHYFNVTEKPGMFAPYTTIKLNLVNDIIKSPSIGPARQSLSCYTLLHN